MARHQRSSLCRTADEVQTARRQQADLRRARYREYRAAVSGAETIGDPVTFPADLVNSKVSQVGVGVDEGGLDVHADLDIATGSFS